MLEVAAAPSATASLAPRAVRARISDHPPRRSAPYEEEPGYHAPSGLWLYGNVKLLHATLAHVPGALGPDDKLPAVLDALEQEAEQLVLEHTVLVCGVHSAAHQRAAVVPLRWGAPRIVVMSGGFWHHLGLELNQEPFRAARLWRYQWDPKCDLAISRRPPDRLPTFARHNPTVDRLIAALACQAWPGLFGAFDSLSPLLSA